MMNLTQTAADSVNRAAWSRLETVTEFDALEGWCDAGERVALAHVADEVRDQPILDIGVGGGRTTAFLRLLSADYTAIDYTPEMVSLTRRKYPELTVLQADARDLSMFETGQFQLVFFSFNGIDAVDHAGRQQILREVRRVLRPGGIFLFSTHNANGPACGEKPWKLGRLDAYSRLGAARYSIRRSVDLPRSVVNYRTMAKLSTDGDGYCMRPAAAHRFTIAIHYTTLHRQLRDLADAGFAPGFDVFDKTRGAAVDPGGDTRSVWWFYIVARTPA